MMPDVAPDFKALLPKTGLDYDGPVYHFWVFHPEDDSVSIHHNRGKHPAEHVTHGQLRKVHHHPETIHGYAYKIHGGWRITDDEHRPVNDPHVVEKVIKALRVSD
jgi:hypothetical protein